MNMWPEPGQLTVPPTPSDPCRAIDRCPNELTEADYAECGGNPVWNFTACPSCRQKLLGSMEFLMGAESRIHEFLIERAERLLPIFHQFDIVNSTFKGVTRVDVNWLLVDIEVIDSWRGGTDYETVRLPMTLFEGDDYIEKITQYYHADKERKEAQAKEERERKALREAEANEKYERELYERLRKKFGGK